MQGGIRRKKDLLPRYKHNGNVRSKSFLTTPMKKILAYVTVLFFIFFLIRTGYSDFNKVPDYELDGNFGSLNSKDKHSNNEMLNNDIVKEKFNNEVAMQQETKNLENDITKPNALKDKLSNKNAQLDA
ncbi:hypothetical protein KAFR_0F02060 [Kazachstania africana CBS 2517]|uniref:Uncharacterized protein n=1 Tax=Kazachstania africana (strain ATCC 22294 / BCRC 22015 / CBS 2517 / CECT 1963 / NBRC 1671 / NRRL Y-8276) TaxID=1071382 RepID=H2AWQ3_KAZAF|nr:hypothetical protein KAFR_0F02060 [Kazachstania africana CBS 2517]CCF58803.1 hypothetical protein KAFR_0F02060 [Kazachstania africana CBS 2517]